MVTAVEPRHASEPMTTAEIEGFNVDQRRRAWLEVRYVDYQSFRPDVATIVAIAADGCLASGVEREGHKLALSQADVFAGGESMGSALERLFCRR